MIKKISLIFIGLFLITFVNAISFNFDQQQNLNSLENENFNNVYRHDLVIPNNAQETFITTNGQAAIDYSLKYNIVNFEYPVYINYYNDIINNTLEFYILKRDNLKDEYEMQVINYTFSNIGEYYFKLENGGQNHNVLILVNSNLESGPFPNTEIFFIHTQPKNFGIIFATFISAIVTILLINFSFFKILFYVLIGAIILNSLFGIILFLLRIFGFVEKITKKKNDVFGGKER